MHILLVQSNVVGEMNDLYLSSSERIYLIHWLETNGFDHKTPENDHRLEYWIREEKTKLTFPRGISGGGGLEKKEVKNGLLARFVVLTNPSDLICESAD